MMGDMNESRTYANVENFGQSRHCSEDTLGRWIVLDWVVVLILHPARF
jgi:hypothetical protein